MKERVKFMEHYYREYLSENNSDFQDFANPYNCTSVIFMILLDMIISFRKQIISSLED